MSAWLSSALTHLLPAFTGANSKQRLNILTFHRVLPEADPFRPSEPTPDIFNWQMRLLATQFNPLSLKESLQRLKDGSLPPRAVCVTFDDGYADNATVALPILQRWSIPATVFVSTDFLNGGRMWNDTVIESIRHYEDDKLNLTDIDLPVFDMHNHSARQDALNEILNTIKHRSPPQRAEAVAFIEAQSKNLPDNLMMSDQQVQQMAQAGVEIGAHTCSHPILTTLDESQLRTELTASRAYLQQLIDKPIRFFAYPNGKRGQDYDLRERDMVKTLGFDAALSTNWGVASKNADLWQLPRFTPWDQTLLRFQLRLLLNYRNTTI